jgi:uncharacterized alkaline shock family protein YloU
MTEEIRIDGLGLAPGVLDTIVTVATQGVEGVAAVGAPGIAGLVQKGARKGVARAVDVCVSEDSALTVAVHIQVFHGQRIPSVATAVQQAVTEALSSQVGLSVEAVDVFVDGLVFPE